MRANLIDLSYLVYRHIVWFQKIKRRRSSLFESKPRKLFAHFYYTFFSTFNPNQSSSFKHNFEPLNYIKINREQHNYDLLKDQEEWVCARSSLFLAYLGYGFIPLEGIGYGIMPKVGRKFQSNNLIRFSGFMWFGKIF